MQGLNFKSIVKSLWPCFYNKFNTILIITVGFSSNAYSAQIISPLLAGLASDKYSSSSNYIGTSEIAFNGGYWNAGDYGWHWIQADAGSEVSVTQLKITIAQSPNGVTQHQIFSSNSNIGNGYGSLTPIYTQNSSTTHGSVLDILFDTPQYGRFFLILSNGGNSWTALGDEQQRTDWDQQVLNVSAVPLPPALIAFSTAMLGIGFLARRKKKSSSKGLV